LLRRLKTKQELLELAATCEGIADNIDDLRASGKLSTSSRR
jgi:hypothetical protein